MSDDRLRGLFGQFAAMAVTVPPADRAADRGRRRRRARFRAATVAWTLVLAGGFGMPQAASIASPSPSNLHIRSSASGAGRSPTPPTSAAGPSGGPTLASKNSSLDQADASSSPSGKRTANRTDQLKSGRVTGRSLPPQGAGRLLLGLDAAGRFVMTRTGSLASPVPVPGIGLPAGAPPVLVTNPAGGWVVVVSSADGWRRVRPSRLAVVATTGKSEPFGPIFFTETVTSAAVDPGGNRVAIALSRPLTRPRIEVVPLPGHRGHDRSWRLRSVRASVVTSLSWAPDGRRLSYLRGQQRPARMSVRGLVTLQVIGRAAATSARLGWPSVAIRGSGCVPDVTAWLGRSGRFAALEHCAGKRTEVFQPAEPRTAVAAGRATVVARRAGCGSAALDPSPAGGAVLISYCGIYLYQHGKLTKVPGGLTAAALAG